MFLERKLFMVTIRVKQSAVIYYYEQNISTFSDNLFQY